MDLKSAGLCMIMAIIVENVDGRHLSGGIFPTVAGRRGLTFPMSQGSFRTGIPSTWQTRFPPHRSQRVSRFPALDAAFTTGPFSSFQPQIGNRRIPLRSFGALRGLDPLGRRSSIERFSTRINPSGLSIRRLRIPDLTTQSGQRTPFAYYRSSFLRPRIFPRRPAIPNDLTSRLRQRFGRIVGSGTRDDPIRIPATLPVRSVALQQGARSQLRQGIRQPVQRVTRQQSRRIQPVRARRPSQTRQQEVIALFGFDQNTSENSGLPVLSETIDKQVQIQRTPIKKTAVPKSSTASVSAKASETKITKIRKSSGPIDGFTLEQLSTQQLEKIVREGAPVITDTKPTMAQNVGITQEESPRAGLSLPKDVISQSEVKKTPKQIKKYREPSNSIQTTLPVKTDIATDSDIKASAKTFVDAIISDADSIKININRTTNVDRHNIVSDATENILYNKDGVNSAISAIKSLPVNVDVDPKGISVIASESTVSKKNVQHSEKIIPIKNTRSSEMVSAFAVPVEKFSSSDSVPVETASSVLKETIHAPESFVPIESDPAAVVAVPIKTAPATEIVVPIETFTKGDNAASSEIIVPFETVHATEIVVPIESVRSNHVDVPHESAATSERAAPVETATLLLETAPASEIIAPFETVHATEIVVPIESVLSNHVDVPIESAATSERAAPVETATLLLETAPASEIIAPFETAHASEIVVPVEKALAKEIDVSIESVPSTIADVPVETAATLETVALIETAHTSESAAPVETATVLLETAPASEKVVPVETVTIGNNVLLTDMVPLVDAVIQAETVPVDTVLKTGILPFEAVSHSETLASKTKPKTVSDVNLVRASSETVNENVASNANNSNTVNTVTHKTHL